MPLMAGSFGHGRLLELPVFVQAVHTNPHKWLGILVSTSDPLSEQDRCGGNSDQPGT